METLFWLRSVVHYVLCHCYFLLLIFLRILWPFDCLFIFLFHLREHTQNNLKLVNEMWRQCAVCVCVCACEKCEQNEMIYPAFKHLNQTIDIKFRFYIRSDHRYKMWFMSYNHITFQYTTDYTHDIRVKFHFGNSESKDKMEHVQHLA